MTSFNAATAFSLKDKVVIVTGGGTGMGFSHARVLASRGAKVAITDFKQDNLDRALTELKRDGLDALCLKADNRIVAEVKAAVAAAEQAFGKVDILVNNAGISGDHAHIEEIDEAFFDSMFGTHVKGAFFATQAVVPGMKLRKFGRIINTGSSFAMTGSPAMSHYTMSKGALTALTRAWARELGADGITVNTVSPGLVETPMTRGADGLFRAADGDLPADPNARLQDGALEGSNVSAVETMVSMIAAARQFEQQMKLLTLAQTQGQVSAKLLSPT